MNNSPSTKDQESSSSSAAKAVEFARLVGRLKTTPRTGWVRRGVPRYESVADHSWRVSALSLLLLGREDINVESKCLPMALAHDVAECVIGDIAPDDNVTKKDKRRMEAEAANDIAQLLLQATSDNDNPEKAGRYLLDLLHEYEERSSNESLAVKDLDLLDMIIQADEYERTFGMDLSEFFDSTPVGRFRDQSIAKIAEEVHRQREERIEENRIESDETAALSKSDQAFVAEYSKALALSSDSVGAVVEALRHWEKR